MAYKWTEKQLKEIKELRGTKKRRTRLTKQYERQGWSDMETWNLDQRFAIWLLPRLKRFYELTNGYPTRYNSMAQWKREIRKLIKAIEWMASEDYYVWGGKKQDKKNDELNEALKFFGENCRDLWW